MSDSTVYQGVVHGNTIEVQQDLGLPDGQQVSVFLQILKTANAPLGEGIQKSAGAWEDDTEELEAYLQWNREQRKRSRTEPEESAS